MSFDAQSRPPQPLPELADLLRARLRRLDFHFTGPLLSCACCAARSVLHCEFDLIEGVWMLRCSRCGAQNERAYADPIRAVLMWNAEQLDRFEQTQAQACPHG